MSEQLYRDDVRYCDATRAGRPHAPHDYRYELPDDGWGAYYCLGQALATWPWPERPEPGQEGDCNRCLTDNDNGSDEYARAVAETDGCLCAERSGDGSDV